MGKSWVAEPGDMPLMPLICPPPIKLSSKAPITNVSTLLLLRNAALRMSVYMQVALIKYILINLDDIECKKNHFALIVNWSNTGFGEET